MILTGIKLKTLIFKYDKFHWLGTYQKFHFIKFHTYIYSLFYSKYFVYKYIVAFYWVLKS